MREQEKRRREKAKKILTNGNVTDHPRNREMTFFQKEKRSAWTKSLGEE